MRAASRNSAIGRWISTSGTASRSPWPRDTFRSLIRDSVAEEIAGHSRVGAFLSGGTDSSTVCGMLGQITGTPTRAYSIGFEAEGYDEMEYARIAARHFGYDHHEYYVTPADLAASLAGRRPSPRPAVRQFLGPACLLLRKKWPRADGCTKMLAGDGGDELFRRQLALRDAAFSSTTTIASPPVSGG